MDLILRLATSSTSRRSLYDNTVHVCTVCILFIGTQACIQAVSTVTGIVADLDTVIMFASSGTLIPEPVDEQAAQRAMESLTINLETPASSSAAETNATSSTSINPESFQVHREAILRTAKALVEDTKSLVVGTVHKCTIRDVHTYTVLYVHMHCKHKCCTVHCF